MPEENIENKNPIDEFNLWQINSDILNLKNKVADAYINKIKDSWFSFWSLLIWKWDMLKDYLVSESVLDKVRDEAKWKFLFQPFIKPLLSESIQYNWKTMTIWEYIEQAKKDLDAASTELELNNLKSIVENKEVSKTWDQSNSAQNSQHTNVQEKSNNIFTWVSATAWAASTVASVESLNSDKREKVIGIINKILKKDLNNPIDYAWWGRESIYRWLDCSWLIIYAFHQAKFNVPWGGDSREIFKSLQTEKVVCENDGIKNIDNVKEGDLLFWNATNPSYDWKGGKTIPTIEKESEKYRIHHMAFVRSIDYAKGEIKIVESNGSEWVTERIINAREVLEKTNHKSELYVGRVNYDDLLAYKAPAWTDISNELV